ncbi:MAG: Protease 4 [Phycisphaerae bacterium]|nr:Protease 4 [Phycisphaerae bacterium]
MQLQRSTLGFMAAVLCLTPAFGWTQEQAAKKIVHLELKGPILEAPQDNPLSGLGGKEMPTTRSLLDKLETIRTDPSVDAVFVTVDEPAMGLAQVQELRSAFERLKANDKEVYVHLDSCYTTGLYWLTSVASKLAVVPTGDVWVTGLYGEQLFLKDALTYLHLDADVIHIGDYKSAGEIVSRNDPSPAALEMINWLYDDLYRQMLEQIASSRQLTTEQLQKLVDQGPYGAEEAQKLGLIDEVMGRKEFVDWVKARHGDAPFEKNYGESETKHLDFSDPFAFFKIFGEMMTPPEESSTPSVALIYVEGPIITGEGEEGMFSSTNRGASTPLRKALHEAAYDDSVKAVVLRVDSPGGSAVASDIIWMATQEVAKNKPFIVSMGNVAGSGGYYVSCGADRIFAEPGTLTGSIGVVGMKLVTKGMWDWMGVHWHPVQRGTNADIMATDKLWTPEHRAKIEGWMNSVYGVFKERVLLKRKDKLTKPIDELAGGRVYTGAQALQLGLVDQLGGLKDALTYAALQANLGEEYEIKLLPKPKTLFDLFMGELGGEARMGAALNSAGALNTLLPMLQTLEPQKAQAFIRTLRQLQTAQQEKILLAMPSEIVIY